MVEYQERLTLHQPVTVVAVEVAAVQLLLTYQQHQLHRGQKP
jgi:hypothetical protein